MAVALFLIAYCLVSSFSSLLKRATKYEALVRVVFAPPILDLNLRHSLMPATPDTLNMDDFGNTIPGRDRDCLRDEPILENAPLSTPPQVVCDDTDVTASVCQAGNESYAPSQCLGQVPSAREKVELRRKTHTRLVRWLPEILSQVAGMLCLLGRFTRSG